MTPSPWGQQCTNTLYGVLLFLGGVFVFFLGSYSSAIGAERGVTAGEQYQILFDDLNHNTRTNRAKRNCATYRHTKVITAGSATSSTNPSSIKGISQEKCSLICDVDKQCNGWVYQPNTQICDLLTKWVSTTTSQDHIFGEKCHFLGESLPHADQFNEELLEFERAQSVKTHDTNPEPDALVIPTAPSIELLQEMLRKLQGQKTTDEDQTKPQDQPQGTKKEHDAVLPFVTIMSLSSGQKFFERNVMMNAFYQTYPHDRLELIVAETSAEPSPFYAKWNQTISDDETRIKNNYPHFSYHHFTETSKNTGWKRNYVMQVAKGDIIVHADNDDILNSKYCQAIVNYFTQYGTNESGVPALEYTPTSPAHRAAPNTTTCCNDKPGGGPTIRNMVLKAPFATGTFNPDGTLTFVEARGGSNIGAVVSYSREVSRTCKWFPRSVQEEAFFLECAKTGFGISNPMDSDFSNEGSAFILRMRHPVSITNIIYYMDRKMWNQLTGKDLEEMYSAIQYWYDFIHEITRPLHVARFPGRLKSTPSWQSFWKTHPTLLVPDQGKPPYCGDFASTPGAVYPRNQKLLQNCSEAATDAMRCCDMCLTKGASCVAWTFWKKTKSCSMEFVQNTSNMPNFEHSPNSNFAADFLEFESAVSPTVCNKCAQSLKLQSVSK